MFKIYGLRDLIRNSDKILLLLPLIFAAVSILMVGSTEYTDQFNITRDLIVQGLAYLIGIILMLLVLAMDYSQLERSTRIMYILSLVLMLLVYTPLGVSQYGSRAWLNLGFITIQPCEFVKLTFTLFYASYLAERRRDLTRFAGFAKAVGIALPIMILIGIEDLGNALVLLFMTIIMIYAAGVDGRVFFRTAAAVIACTPLAYLAMKPHQRQRIDAFLNPGDKSLAGNYQVWNSKVAIGSGGFSGKGLFQGTQKSLNYLPVAKSDFIFSVICEELGFIGGIALVAMYTLFLGRIIHIARNARDHFGRLIVTGLAAMFFFQIFENIGMTMGIMPVTGITLPFISYGGTSVIANLLALGMILGIGARSKIIHF